MEFWYFKDRLCDIWKCEMYRIYKIYYMLDIWKCTTKLSKTKTFSRHSQIVFFFDFKI